MDPKIEYKIKKIQIPEGVAADVYLQIDFMITDSSGNILDKWNVKEGENIDWGTFFTIDSLKLTSDGNRLITNPESKLDFEWIEKENDNNSTYLEALIKYEGMSEGDYSLGLVTNGLKEWNN